LRPFEHPIRITDRESACPGDKKTQDAVVTELGFFLAQRRSKVELEPDLDQPRIVAGGDYASKSPHCGDPPGMASMEVVGTELRLLSGWQSLT